MAGRGQPDCRGAQQPLILLYPREALPESHREIEESRAAYEKAFQQESVLRADDDRPVYTSFQEEPLDITLLPAQRLRSVQEVKSLVRDWAAQQALRWPELRAAHLTGGMTALDDDDLFPAEKDVDLHLIFPDQSALLQVDAMPLLEMQYAGLAIEAGLKPMTWYRSPQPVLGNPEIAYHLTRETICFDPAGHLLALQPEVRRRHAEVGFVQERELSMESRALRQGEMSRLREIHVEIVVVVDELGEAMSATDGTDALATVASYLACLLRNPGW